MTRSCTFSIGACKIKEGNSNVDQTGGLLCDGPHLNPRCPYRIGVYLDSDTM